MVTEQAADVYLCFDANLPKMISCRPKCEDNSSILCLHRFNFNARIVRCNTKRFGGWQDLRILLYFLKYIRQGIEESIIPKEALFVLVTKDRKFIEAAELEWSEYNSEEQLMFGDNFVRLGDITIFIQSIDCKNYGDSGPDNLKCVVHKMNNFFRRRNR